MSATTGKLFFRDQNGVIYESPDNITGYITDTGIDIDTDDEDDFDLVRSDATIRDYDYEAEVNDLAGASAGNISFALERLLDRNTLMPSEDAAKIIRNVPADNGSIDKLYRTFRFFSDNVPWFGETLSMLMDLEDEGDEATLAAMKFKKLAGSKQDKPGKNLSRFLGDVFKPAELAGYNQTPEITVASGRPSSFLFSVASSISSSSMARSISSVADANKRDENEKEHLLKFATFWVILSEKLSAAYTTKGQ